MIENECILNMAAFCPNSRVLGPGLRAVVWVQGCPFRCEGCLAPDWIPDYEANSINIYTLANQILSIPEIDGITISGGEPMLQARPLYTLVKRIKQERDIDVICFTGFKLSALYKFPSKSYVDKLLSEVDVLIDGPYISEQNNGYGLRGSQNQTIHYLTSRLADKNLEEYPHQTEIHMMNGKILQVGIPQKGFVNVMNQIMSNIQALGEGLVTR